MPGAAAAAGSTGQAQPETQQPPAASVQGEHGDFLRCGLQSTASALRPTDVAVRWSESQARGPTVNSLYLSCHDDCARFSLIHSLAPSCAGKRMRTRIKRRLIDATPLQGIQNYLLGPDSELKPFEPNQKTINFRDVSG